MQALLLKEPGRFVYEERAMPQPAAGEVLVKVDAVSICGSDIHAINGKMPLFVFPRVIGHEIAATVVETNASTTALQPGDRVCVMPTIACGKCIACRKGKTNCCVALRLYGVQADGGLQEYMALPEEALLKIHDGATPDEISLIEPLTIGAHAVSRVHLDAGDRALVLGAGPIGICCAIMARAEGTRVVLADVNRERAEFVEARFGFPVLDPRGSSYKEDVASMTGGDLFHAVFDTTANKQSMDAAYTLIGNGGAVVFVGMHSGLLEIDEAKFHMKEPTLAVTRNSTKRDFARVLHMWSKNLIQPGVLQTHHMDFIAAADRLPSWASGTERVFKGVVRLYS